MSTPDVYVLGGNDSLKFSETLEKFGGTWEKLRDSRMGWTFNKENYKKVVNWMNTLVSLDIVNISRGKYRIIGNTNFFENNSITKCNESTKSTKYNESTKCNEGKNIELYELMKKLVSIQCNICYDTFIKIWNNDCNHFFDKWQMCEQNVIIFYNSLDSQNQEVFLKYIF
jgi:hypothetical protein